MGEYRVKFSTCIDGKESVFIREYEDKERAKNAAIDLVDYSSHLNRSFDINSGFYASVEYHHVYGWISIFGETYINEGDSMQETHIATTTTKQPDGAADTIYSSETVATGQESSVEITQGANGNARVCVKVYHADPKEAALQAMEVYQNTVRILRSRNL